MKKFTLLVLSLFLSLSCFSQNKNRKQFECLLIDRKNDTTHFIIYNTNKKEQFNPFFMHLGFNAYDSKGIKKDISPKQYKYAIVKDSINGDSKFKSINKQLNKNKKPKHVFMNFITEYSNIELKKGKLNVYAMLFKFKNNYNERLVYIYLEDKNGLHFINTKKERIFYLGENGNKIFNSIKTRLKLAFFTNNAKIKT